MPPKLTNRLGDALSPYLRSHAADGIAWQPWDEEALSAASELDRPILLSIGYEACHWCQVMAEESFRDSEVVDLLNRLFVCIKVDREERPDLDRAYQAAQQLLTQRGGGWPLTMFLNPSDASPFFGGTYFPPDDRYGMPGFKDLLTTASNFYRDETQRAMEQGSEIVDTVRALELPPESDSRSQPHELVAAARDVVFKHFDGEHGGFVGAPKFPNTPFWHAALELWRLSADTEQPDVELLFRVAKTGTEICAGGIFDHIDGGFFRYTTDPHWREPHFEKMLGENATLLSWVSALYAVSGEEIFLRTTANLCRWLAETMWLTNGGYASSTAADFRGIEGGYYKVEASDLDDLKTAEATGEQLLQSLELQNAVDHPTCPPFRSSAHELLDADTEAKLISTLQVQRRARAPEGVPRDEKELTHANALLVEALATSGMLCGDQQAIEMAKRLYDRLRDAATPPDALCGFRIEGRFGPVATLDDHASLLTASLTMLQIEFNDDWLAFALSIAEFMLEAYFDADTMLFRMTQAEVHQPLGTLYPVADDALPAANALAVKGFLQLGHVLGEARLLDCAHQIMNAAGPRLLAAPRQYMSLISLVAQAAIGFEVIVIRGSAETSKTWCQALSRIYSPNRMIIDLGERTATAFDALTQKCVGQSEAVSALVCRGQTCSLPIDDFSQLNRELRRTSAAAAAVLTP